MATHPSDPSPLETIVLAAGGSTRMGTWKLLLPWQGLTVVETVVEEARAACHRVIVVAGYRSTDLEELFGGLEGVEVVTHPGWRKGQFTSLQRGLAEVRSEAFFVTLADMPGVTRSVFADLAWARAQASPAGTTPRAVRPGSSQHPGHPVLFDAPVRDLILTMDPARSMRDVFPRLALTYIPAVPGAWDDVDAPSDYTPGVLDPARTRCPPRLFAEATNAARRMT